MFRVLLAMSAIIILATPVSANAEMSIAVVDVQKLMGDSDAAKSIEKQVTAKREKFVSELSKKEKGLRETEKKLAGERSKLSKEDFTKKAQEFEKSLMSTREMAQKTKKQYDDATGKALSQLRDKAVEVVSAIAKEKGYQLVLSKQGVVVSAQGIDITDEAMANLNKAVSNITVDFGK
jgi:outer membrane protein